MKAQPLPSAEEFEPVRPQKRTQATWSIQNKADAYIASLKGIKVDLPEDNPYLKKESLEEDVPPQRRILMPPAPPTRPLGPKMSYAERLKLAKEAKAGESGSAAAPAAAEAPAAAPAASAAPRSAEKPRPAPEVTTAATPPPPPPPASPPVSVATSAASPTTRLLEQEVPESSLLGEDAAKAKVRPDRCCGIYRAGSFFFVYSGVH